MFFFSATFSGRSFELNFSNRYNNNFKFFELQIITMYNIYTYIHTNIHRTTTATATANDYSDNDCNRKRSTYGNYELSYLKIAEEDRERFMTD
jgi:hypothetical protein